MCRCISIRIHTIARERCITHTLRHLFMYRCTCVRVCTSRERACIYICIHISLGVMYKAYVDACVCGGLDTSLCVCRCMCMSIYMHVYVYVDACLCL